MRRWKSNAAQEWGTGNSQCATGAVMLHKKGHESTNTSPRMTHFFTLGPAYDHPYAHTHTYTNPPIANTNEAIATWAIPLAWEHTCTDHVLGYLSLELSSVRPCLWQALFKFPINMIKNWSPSNRAKMRWSKTGHPENDPKSIWSKTGTLKSDQNRTGQKLVPWKLECSKT
jgi:hypothetical protein